MPANGKTILISGGLVYDDDGNTNHPGRADISIIGDTIASVDPCDAGELRAAHADVVIDATDRLVLPGPRQCPLSFARCAAEGLLRKLFPRENLVAERAFLQITSHEVRRSCGRGLCSARPSV